MHDGIHLERRGVPVAVLCTDPFVATARTMARAQGIPDYPIVILPSPIATLDGGGLDAQADRAIAQVVAILLAHD